MMSIFRTISQGAAKIKTPIALSALIAMLFGMLCFAILQLQIFVSIGSFGTLVVLLVIIFLAYRLVLKALDGAHNHQNNSSRENYKWQNRSSDLIHSSRDRREFLPGLLIAGRLFRKILDSLKN